MPSPAAPRFTTSRLGPLLSGQLRYLSVAVGLGVYGLAVYVFLALAGQVLGPAAFAPLSVLWTLLNAVGIGLFLPFEQELSRTTAAQRALGQGNAPVVGAVFRMAGILLAVVAVVCLGAWSLLTSRLFHGETAMVPLLIGALFGMAVAYVARGLLAGNGRYARYGAQFVVDGVVRIIGAVLLLLIDIRSSWAFAVVLVVAPLVAVLTTTPRRATVVVPGDHIDAHAIRRALVALIVASLAAQLLANAGTLIVQLRATDENQELSGQFLAALTIARLPVFAFAAVQAVLLPGLAALVGGGNVAGFRRRLGLVTLVTGAYAVFGTAIIWVWGDALVPLLFGEAFGVGRRVITLLALSGGLFMLAQLAVQALLALSRERVVVVGWGSGVAALVIAATLPGELTMVSAVALTAGSGVALLILTWALLRSLRSWSAQQRSVLE